MNTPSKQFSFRVSTLPTPYDAALWFGKLVAPDDQPGTVFLGTATGWIEVGSTTAISLSILMEVRNNVERTLADPYTDALTTSGATDLQTAIDALDDGDILEIQTNATYDPITIPSGKSFTVRVKNGYSPILTGNNCITLLDGASNVIITGLIIDSPTTTDVNGKGSGICLDHEAVVSNIYFYNITMRNATGSGVLLSYHQSIGGDNYATPNVYPTEFSNRVAFIDCNFYQACADGNEGANILLRGITEAVIMGCRIDGYKPGSSTGGRGIGLLNCIEAYVYENTILNCNLYNGEGIKLDRFSTGSNINVGWFVRNKVQNCIEAIDIDDYCEATLIGNVCKDSTKGISIDNNAVAKIIANICFDNTTGIVSESGAIVNLKQNNCFNNTTNYNTAGYTPDSSNISDVNNVFIDHVHPASDNGYWVSENMVLVEPSSTEIVGKKYQSITNAIAYINGLTGGDVPSDINRYSIFVTGVHNDSFTIPEYTSIVGLKGSTILDGMIDSSHIINVTTDYKDRCIITNCIVTGLYINGTDPKCLYLKDCTITSFSSEESSRIHILVFEDCNINEGAALYQGVASIYANSCLFEKCSLTDGLEALNCKFRPFPSSNTISLNGGKLRTCTIETANIAFNPGTYEVTNCHFDGNMAFSGPGVAVTAINSDWNGSMTISNSAALITNNCSGTKPTTATGGTWTNIGAVYDNTSSALVATNVQSAIDELDSRTDPTGLHASRTYWVDRNRNDSYTPDGSIYKPYLTIQAAIDAVELLITTNETTGYIVKILGGDYSSENIVIKKSLSLEGMSWLSTRINSLTFRPVSAILGVWDCRISNLVVVSNVTISGETAPSSGIFYPSMAGNEIMFVDCTIYGNITADTVNFLSAQGLFVAGNVTTSNVAGIWYNFTEVSGTVTINYDTANPEPSDTGAYGYCSYNGRVENLTLNTAVASTTAAKLDAKNLVISSILTVGALSEYSMQGGYVGTLIADPAAVENTYVANEPYDNSTSGLTAKNVQDAIDELASAPSGAAITTKTIIIDSTTAAVAGKNYQTIADAFTYINTNRGGIVGVAIGNGGSITSVSDIGGSPNVISFAVLGHNIAVGETVYISGTTDYDGAFTVVAGGDADNFRIEHAFTTTKTGTCYSRISFDTSVAHTMLVGQTVYIYATNYSAYSGYNGSYTVAAIDSTHIMVAAQFLGTSTTGGWSADNNRYAVLFGGLNTETLTGANAIPWRTSLVGYGNGAELTGAITTKTIYVDSITDAEVSGIYNAIIDNLYLSGSWGQAEYIYLDNCKLTSTNASPNGYMSLRYCEITGGSYLGISGSIIDARYCNISGGTFIGSGAFHFCDVGGNTSISTGMRMYYRHCIISSSALVFGAGQHYIEESEWRKGSYTITSGVSMAFMGGSVSSTGTVVLTVASGGVLSTQGVAGPLSVVTSGSPLGTWYNYGDKYDNRTSGLTATNVQTAIDEIATSPWVGKNMILINPNAVVISGKRYQTITAAIVYINGLTGGDVPAEENRYSIFFTGFNNDEFIIPEYVAIIGLKGSSILAGSVDSAHTISGGIGLYDKCVIANCRIEGLYFDGTDPKCIYLDNCQLDMFSTGAASAVHVMTLDRCHVTEGVNLLKFVNIYAKDCLIDKAIVPAGIECRSSKIIADNSVSLEGGLFIDCVIGASVTFNAGTSTIVDSYFSGSVSLSGSGIDITVRNCTWASTFSIANSASLTSINCDGAKPTVSTGGTWINQGGVYDNTSSELTATNEQAAIDEVNEKIIPLAYVMARRYTGDLGVEPEWELLGGRNGNNTREITSSDDIETTDDTIFANSSSALELTLPSAVGLTGKIYAIKNINTGAVTVTPDGSETIEDAVNKVLSAKYSTITIESNGANWYMLSYI